MVATVPQDVKDYGNFFMWTKPNIPFLLAVVALLGTCCSAVNADTVKAVSPHPSDQATVQLTQTDEPLPGEALNPNSRPQPKVNSQGCSNNEAGLPCLTIQQVILSPGAGRQLVFGQAFAKVVISDPDLIEVITVSDKTLFIRTIKQEKSVTENSGNTSKTYTLSTFPQSGKSEISVYDKEDNRIGVIEVTIDPWTFRRNIPVLRDQFAVRAGSIVIYNGKKRGEASYYRCTSEMGCVYVGN